MPRTNQQVFNITFKGLRKQGFRQSKNGVTCLYRSVDKDGTPMKCAAGFLIPDDKYNENMECATADRADIVEAMNVKSVDFVVKMQEIHDSYTDPESMEKHLRNLANDHKLTIPGEKV